MTSRSGLRPPDVEVDGNDPYVAARARGTGPTRSRTDELRRNRPHRVNPRCQVAGDLPHWGVRARLATGAFRNAITPTLDPV